MKIIAFDPGRVCSYAILDTLAPHEVTVGELDLVGAGRLIRPCGQHIRELLEDGVDCAIVEEVGARQGQGSSSIFTFGLSTGAILNAIGASRVSLDTVTPPQWKRASRIHSSSETDVKDLARAYATQLWPARRDVFKIKKNHGQAEAALMARWFFLKGPGRDAADKETKAALAG
ncbi:MAG: hypothetical protein CMO01_00390 [Thalassobius sp.]|nr:hypothetical protein [Thalassovita sp.]